MTSEKLVGGVLTWGTKPMTVRSDGCARSKYAQLCGQCHQVDLTGSDQGPSLAGPEFLDRWNDRSVGDLADRIRLTMPVEEIGSLNMQTSTDITAYLLQANNFPAGQEELKADRSAMKSLVIKRK